MAYNWDFWKPYCCCGVKVWSVSAFSKNRHSWQIPKLKFEAGCIDGTQRSCRDTFHAIFKKYCLKWNVGFMIIDLPLNSNVNSNNANKCSYLKSVTKNFIDSYLNWDLKWLKAVIVKIPPASKSGFSPHFQIKIIINISWQNNV